MVSTPTPEELSLDAPWRIGERGFAALVAELEATGVRTLLEFGAGASSVRLARALPHVEILSVEHDGNYLDDVKRLAQKHAAGSGLTFRHSRLGWRVFENGLFFGYSKVDLPEAVDAVIIDGPPHWVCRGREAVLYDVFPRLRTGGRVYLDDAHRAREAGFVRNWRRVYAGAVEVSAINGEHTIARVEKIKDVPARSDAWTFCDDAFAHGKWLVSRAVGRVRIP